ncbi:MAG TPA: hypothetical protein VF327_09110 [Gaiellaceae bacterium]
MITALLALAALGATVAYAVATGGRLAPAALGIGALSLVVLALGIVFRWPSAVPWAVLFAAGAYLVGRESKHVVDGWAAAIGVLLLISAELATWSLEHDARIRSERALTIRRIATLTVLGGVALLMNFLLLGTAALTASASIVLAAAGIAASVSALVVVLRLTRG